MNGAGRLAWRHLRHHRGRSLLLVACIALAFLVPAAVELLVRHHARAFAARAAATPLVLGARGSRFDLVLDALYFQGRVPRPLPFGRLDDVERDGLALAIPLRGGLTARGLAVVGTSLDYFEFRGLAPAAGTLPQVLGDVVVGAAAAEELGVAPGDVVLTDRGSVFDLSLAYPLRLRVSGVLARRDGADDRALFVDVRTAWIAEGIGHGHGAAAAQDDDKVLARDDAGVVLNAAVTEYAEIGPENLDDFHFHGDPAAFPLTAALVVPRDDKARTILKGRFRVDDAAQLVVPAEVLDEILGFVLKLKRFFDANLALVASSVALFLLLVVLLSIRVRRREFETLQKLGASRGTVAAVVGIELLLQIGAGLAAAVLLGLALFATIASRGPLGT